MKILIIQKASVIQKEWALRTAMPLPFSKGF